MTQTPQKPLSTWRKAWQTPWINNTLWLIGAFSLYLIIRPFMQGNVIHGQIPNLTLTSLTGHTLTLKDIKQPTLIHFWATWCPICKTMDASISALSKDHPVIAIATQSGTNQAITQFAQQHNLPLNIIINDKDGKLLKLFGARAVPADFIIDAQGNIQFIEVGYSTELGLRLRLWWLRQ